MSRSDFTWFFKSLFKLSLNCVLLIPRVESFFKGFLIFILVHASTEFSKNIRAILILFLLRRSPNGRSSASFAEQRTPWTSGRRMRGGSSLGDGVQKGDHRRIPWTSGRRRQSNGGRIDRSLARKKSDMCVLFGANSLGLGDFPSTGVLICGLFPNY